MSLMSYYIPKPLILLYIINIYNNIILYIFRGGDMAQLVVLASGVVPSPRLAESIPRL